MSTAVMSQNAMYEFGDLILKVLMICSILLYCSYLLAERVLDVFENRRLFYFALFYLATIRNLKFKKKGTGRAGELVD